MKVGCDRYKEIVVNIDYYKRMSFKRTNQFNNNFQNIESLFNKKQKILPSTPLVKTNTTTTTTSDNTLKSFSNTKIQFNYNSGKKIHNNSNKILSTKVSITKVSQSPTTLPPPLPLIETPTVKLSEECELFNDFSIDELDNIENVIMKKRKISSPPTVVIEMPPSSPMNPPPPPTMTTTTTTSTTTTTTTTPPTTTTTIIPETESIIQKTSSIERIENSIKNFQKMNITMIEYMTTMNQQYDKLLNIIREEFKNITPPPPTPITNPTTTTTTTDTTTTTNDTTITTNDTTTTTTDTTTIPTTPKPLTSLELIKKVCEDLEIEKIPDEQYIDIEKTIETEIKKDV